MNPHFKVNLDDIKKPGLLDSYPKGGRRRCYSSMNSGYPLEKAIPLQDVQINHHPFSWTFYAELAPTTNPFPRKSIQEQIL